MMITLEEAPDIMAARVDKALEAIAAHTSLSPEVGVILGSGQGGFSRRLEGASYIPFQKIPYFFQPAVPGHEGVMSLGKLNGLEVAVLEGRIHLYEGYFMREIVFPVRVFHRLGVRNLVVCNAAGGLSQRLSAGDVMLVSDHINLMGTNPLIGHLHRSGQSPFLDMTDTYHRGFREKALETGRELGEELPEGVLAAVPGPCYETPAESRMLVNLGADAVTMSTVPGVIMARFLGMSVLGLSLITNLHRQDASLDHKEVLDVAHQRIGFLMELIARVVLRIPAGRGG
jgi:purine-nucleoside phosphorylase